MLEPHPCPGWAMRAILQNNRLDLISPYTNLNAILLAKIYARFGVLSFLATIHSRQLP
jgi:hypothetical protein